MIIPILMQYAPWKSYDSVVLCSTYIINFFIDLYNLFNLYFGVTVLALPSPKYHLDTSEVILEDMGRCVSNLELVICNPISRYLEFYL